MPGIQTFYVKQSFNATDESTSVTSGALVSLGGLGVTGTFNLGGLFVSYNTTDAVSTTSGALQTYGGMGIAKKLYVGDAIFGRSTIDATGANMGALQLLGGASILKSIYIGGNAYLNGNFAMASTTDSSSTSSGSFVTSGGVGIAKSLYVGMTTSLGGQVNMLSTVNSTSTDTGGLIISGGVGVAGTVSASGLKLVNTVTTIDTDGTLAANSDSNLATQRATKTYVDTLASLIKNPTGFPTTTTSTISVDNAQRQFTIAPVTTSFDYYIGNVKYTKSAAETITINDVTGLHYIYYNGATLSETVNFSYDLIASNAYIAVVYWNSSHAVFVHMGDQRHGCSMSPDTHYNLQYSVGTAYITGITPANFVIGDGSLDSHAEFTITSGTIMDQDLIITIASKATISTTMKCLYLDGVGWTYETATGAFNSDGTKLFYNYNNAGSWSLVGLTDNNYVIGHIVATNDGTSVAIIGQTQYSSIIAAQQGAANEISNLYLVNLPFEDWVFVASIIYQSNSTFANASKGAIVLNASGTNYIDWREKKLNSSAGTPTSHGTLSGLTNDDHLQYVTVNGRSTDVVVMNNTANVSGTTGGAVRVLGGAYIAKTLTVGGDLNVSGALGFSSAHILATDESTSVTSGALVVDGGVGIAKNAHIGGIATISNSTEATAVGTGALIVSGGISATKNLHVGGLTVLDNTTESSTFNDGSLVVDGGVGIVKNLNVGGAVGVTGIATILNTTNSTTSSDGAFIVDGGVGVVKNLNVGGTVGVTGIATILNTTNSSSPSDGAFIVDGGVGVVKNLHVGGLTVLDNTTESSTFNDGSLVVDGGVGIVKNLNVGGAVGVTGIATILNTTNSTTSTDGAFIVDGGVGIVKNLNVAGIATVLNTTNSTTFADGAFVVDGGVGIAKNLNVGENVGIVGTTSITNTTNATSATTGALVVSGGLGIASDTVMGGLLSVKITTESTSATSGAMVISGGAGIVGNMHVGSTTVVASTNNATDASSGAVQIAGGIGVAKDIVSNGNSIQISNNYGKTEERIITTSLPVIVAQSATATIDTLTVSDPITVKVLISGYDNETKTFTAVCESTFVFMLDGTAVVSLTGDHGSPESLYWNKANGWEFVAGAFTFTDEGSGVVNIKFTHNGTKTESLYIGSIKINTTIGIVP